MRLIATAVVLLDCLTVLLGLLFGFLVAVGMGMARVPNLKGDPPPPPVAAWQSNVALASGVVLAVVAIAPSALFLWRGHSVLALALAVTPLLIGCALLWPLRGAFNL